MSLTSYKAAGSGVDDSGVGTITWVADDSSTALSGTEVTSDDNVYAGLLAAGSATSHYLKCTSFGFTSGDVPSGATINGFEIEFRELWSNISPAVTSTTVKFCKGGTIQGNNIGGSGGWPTSETPTVYGSSTELGGLSWTQSDVTASNFGCAISVVFAAGASILNRTIFVDQVRIRIYYTVAASSLTGISTITGISSITF